MADSIITRVDAKRLSKNRLVKVHDFRGATLAGVKKKPDVIMLHFGTNDSVFTTSRKIFDDFS